MLKALVMEFSTFVNHQILCKHHEKHFSFPISALCPFSRVYFLCRKRKTCNVYNGIPNGYDQGGWRTAG